MKFRVIIRNAENASAALRHIAFMPDMSADIGKIAYLAFDVYRGEILPDHYGEMPISCFWDTASLPKQYLEAFYSPTYGIFHLLKEHLEADPDPVSGDVVLRYRMPNDLKGSAWKWFFDGKKGESEMNMNEERTYIREIGGKWFAFAGNQDDGKVYSIGGDSPKDGRWHGSWTDAGIRYVACASASRNAAYQKARRYGTYCGEA